MYELDHMLNGKQSSLHHQELIRMAEQERMLRAAKPDSEQRRAPQPLHAILALLMKVIGSI